MSAEAIAIVGVGVALLAVLVPLLLTVAANLGRRIDSLAADVAEVRRALHALAERVARIEGALTGPWLPTNGTPTPASKTPPSSESAVE